MPQMRKQLGLMVTAIVVFGEIAVAALAQIQNAQLIHTIIPPKYLAPEYLLAGFGIALIIVYLSARSAYPAVAKIRARYDPVGFHVTNVGESEANDVQILPLGFSDFPWIMTFDVEGSLPHGNEIVPRWKFSKRKDLVWPCEDCLNRYEPNDFSSFLALLGVHGIELRLRSMKAGESSQLSEDAEMQLLRIQHFGIGSVVLGLTVEYFNGRWKDRAHHRVEVDFEFAKGRIALRRAHVVYSRTATPHPVVSLPK